MQEKANQASELVREFDYDCWITFVRESGINGDPVLDLILGFEVTWQSAFVFDSGGGRTAIVGSFDADAVKDLGVYDKVIGYVESIEQPLLGLLRNLDPERIGANYSIGSDVCDGITHGMYLYLQSLVSKIGMTDRIVSAEPLVSALRERKSPTETGLIKRAVDETEIIFDGIAQFAKQGMSENNIAEFMRKAASEKGFGMSWQPSACPAVFTGPDAVSGHYGPTDRLVEPGHIIHIDFGVRGDGYCSDLQRGFYVLREGETEPPEDVRKAYSTVFRAIDKAARELKPGSIGWEIDKIARDEVTGAGYDEYACALGHQVGRYAHDGTALLAPRWERYADRPMRKIEEGMIFTLEPHIKVPGHGTASIEEMVVVTATGCEFLSNQQKQIYLIDWFS